MDAWVVRRTQLLMPTWINKYEKLQSTNITARRNRWKTEHFCTILTINSFVYNETIFLWHFQMNMSCISCLLVWCMFNSKIILLFVIIILQYGGHIIYDGVDSNQEPRVCLHLGLTDYRYSLSHVMQNLWCESHY